jgi:hypothetical protein
MLRNDIIRALLLINCKSKPVIPGSASASKNEKWPASGMQMQSQAKLPLILHSLIFGK